MLIDGGLRLHAVQGVHLQLGLLQLHGQHGALHLRRRALLRLQIKGGQEQDIERHQHRGQELADDQHVGVQRIGVHRGGIVKYIIGNRQAAEQQQRPPGVGHGGIGRLHQKALAQPEHPHQQDDVRNVGGQHAAGQGFHGVLAPAQRLAAQIGRAGADHSHAQRLFQRQRQYQHQRQVDDQRVQLHGLVRAQRQRKQGLQHQKHGAQQRHQLFVSFFGAAAGDGYAEKQPVDQHQPVVEHVQRRLECHVKYALHASLPENSSSR